MFLVMKDSVKEETTDNGGGDSRGDPGQGEDVSGALLELPAKLLKEAVGLKGFGETLCMFKLIRDVSMGLGGGLRFC